MKAPNNEGTVTLSSQNVKFLRCRSTKPNGRGGVQNSVSTAHRWAHNASAAKIRYLMLFREIVDYCHNYPGHMNRLYITGKMLRFLMSNRAVHVVTTLS